MSAIERPAATWELLPRCVISTTCRRSRRARAIEGAGPAAISIRLSAALIQLLYRFYLAIARSGPGTRVELAHFVGDVADVVIGEEQIARQEHAALKDLLSSWERDVEPELLPLVDCFAAP